MFHACFAMLAVGQQYSPNNLYGVSMPRGLFMTSLGIPQDTAALDPYARMYPHIAIKNNVFYGWSVPDQKWKAVVSGASASEVDPVYTANGVPKSRHIVINGEDHTLDADANFTVTNGPETDPLYTANGVPKSRMIFINGEGHDLTSNPAFTVVGSPVTRWYNTLPGTALGDATANFESIINFNDVASGLYFVSDSMRYSSPTTQRGLSSIFRHGLDAAQWQMRDTEGVDASQSIRYHSATVYPDNFTLSYSNDFNGGGNHISQIFVNGDGRFQADGTYWNEGGLQSTYGIDMDNSGGSPNVSIYATPDNSGGWNGSWARLFTNIIEVKSPSIQLRDYDATGAPLYYFTLNNSDGLVYRNSIAGDRGASTNYDLSLGANIFRMNADDAISAHSTISGSAGGDIVEDFTSTFWLKYAGVNTLYAGVDGVKIETAFALDGISDATDLTGKKVLVRDETTGDVTKIDASAIGGGGSTDIYSDLYHTDLSPIALDAPGSYITRLLRMRDTIQGTLMISDTMYYSGKNPDNGDNYSSIISRTYSGVNMNFADTTTGAAALSGGNYQYASGYIYENVSGFNAGSSYTFPNGTTTFNSQLAMNAEQFTADMYYDSTYAGIHYEAGWGGEFMRLSLLTKNGQPDQTTTQIELLRDSLLIQSQYIDIHGTLRLNTQQSAPTSSSDTSGTPGEMRLAPTGELYVKTGTGWLKFTGATF